MQRIVHKSATLYAVSVESTKQPSLLWVNDNLEAKIEHALLDPDVNFLYTRRKRRLLGLDDTLDPNTPNSSSSSDSTKKIAFPTDGWGTALAKNPLFTCAEMDRHIANSGKKHQNSEYYSLPTGLTFEIHCISHTLILLV